MRAQYKNATSAERGCALTHDQIAFLLVERIGQRVRGQRGVFRDCARHVGAISGNAARENKLSNARSRVAIRLGDRFHHSRRTGNVDPPHAVNVEHSRALRIDHKRQMDHRYGLRFPQQQ